MIQLHDDRLTFSFPAICHRLPALLDEHLRTLVPKLLRPEPRHELFRAIESSDVFGKRSAEQQAELRTFILDSTAAEIDAALRKIVADKFDLHDESLAEFSISFHRTLRIPDDGRTYPLPASLRRFPLRSVDDYAETVPDSWLRRGGALMPMYQSEALWLDFSSSYPFAAKIAAGKINAVSGEPWTDGLQRDPQNYVVVPSQPWLDGFSVGKGTIRQFVAMPLGDGYTVEEQLTGRAEVGGMQVQVFPLSAEAYFRDEIAAGLPATFREYFTHYLESLRRVLDRPDHDSLFSPISRCLEAGEMGLGAGGKMRQEIYRDQYDFADWDQTQSARCFVHLCNSLVWRQITGENPPHPPLTAREYKAAGIPWFDYYRDDLEPLKGSQRLAGVESVAQLGQENGKKPLPENTSVDPSLIIQYGNTRRPGEIREFLDAP